MDPNNLYCHRWLDYGVCESKNECQFKHPPLENYNECKFYLDGNCTSGIKCTRRHSRELLEVLSAKQIGEFSINLQKNETKFGNVVYKQLADNFESPEHQRDLFIDLKARKPINSIHIEDYKIDRMLKYLIHTSNGSSLSAAANDCNFVTSRSTLKFIGAKWKANWEAVFIKFKNIIFFSLIRSKNTPSLEEQRKKARSKIFVRPEHGLKFEQSAIKCDSNNDDITNKDYFTYGVFKRTFKYRVENDDFTCSVLFSAEIDCKDKDGDIVELKVTSGKNEEYETLPWSPEPDAKNDNPNWFWPKMALNWLQCDLMGCERLIYGVVNENQKALVRELNTFDVKWPDAKQSDFKFNTAWSSYGCYNFILAVVMHEAKCQLDNYEEGTVLVAKYKANEKMTNWPKMEIVHQPVPERYNILSDEFIQTFQ